MAQSPQPNWQPISQLPLLVALLEGILAATTEQHQTFMAVQNTPHVLDDRLVNQAIKAYQTQLEFIAIYEQQLTRWQAESLTNAQQEEVTRLQSKLQQIIQLSQEILELLSIIKEGTIDQVMRKTDVELALEFLQKKQPKP
jgi:recombinational DNA repair ATPase RecF